MWRSRRTFVEFGIEQHLLGVFELPDQARHSLPHAYRTIPRTLSDRPLAPKSVRGCMPFFDAMTYGFAIPLPYDLAISSRDNGAEIELATPPVTNAELGLDGNQLATVIPQQALGALSPYPVFKLETPYWVRTSAPVSSLITAPLNHFSPVGVVSGLIDSDRIDTKLKLFIYWLGPDGDHSIKAGTTVAQLLPIRRDRTALRKHTLDPEETRARNAHQLRSRIDSGAYKRLWRAPRHG
jgi:hypothetical protein